MAETVAAFYLRQAQVLSQLHSEHHASYERLRQTLPARIVRLATF